MAEEPLNKDKDFTVNESRTTDLLITIFFLSLFIIGVVAINSNKDTNPGLLYSLLVITTLLPAIRWGNRLRLAKIAITINKDGIYHFTSMITNWTDFFDAHIFEREVAGSYEDHFVLVIEYYKDKGETLVVHEINMSDSFDKSEEQIIAAIKFFSGGADGPPE